MSIHITAGLALAMVATLIAAVILLAVANRRQARRIDAMHDGVLDVLRDVTGNGNGNGPPPGPTGRRHLRPIRKRV